MDIKKLVKPNVRSLRAYQAEEIPCKVKLDANESPYGFTVLRSVKTNKYPDPEAKLLRKLIAKELKVKAENILHGNGSDELIYYLITAFGGPVLYPVPTFSMYGIISLALGEKKIEISLDKRFDIDLDRTLIRTKKDKPKLIFLSSPNNPSGNCFSSDRILTIIKQSKGIVVVDEAYQPFSDKKSFLPLLKKYKNLIVLRTLSKIGLAGLRAGFMIADKEIINEVNKVRLPFNLNSLSQKIAVNALKNQKQMQEFRNKIKTEREKIFQGLKKLNRIEPYPSDANFILFKIENANRIYKNLLKRGILVRNMKGIVNDCLRVTVGTPKENATFLKALKQLL
jgi:histidinol-phosphate aminotransferase